MRVMPFQRESQVWRLPSQAMMRAVYAVLVGGIIVYFYMISHVDQVVACWQHTTDPGRACHGATSDQDRADATTSSLGAIPRPHE